MILTAFFKALTQLPDPRFRRVLLLGIGLTIALLVAAYAGLLWVIQAATADGVTLPWVGQVSWIGDLLSWGSLGVMILLSMFLMVPVASAITSLFLNDVAQAVEDVHYPHLHAVPPSDFWEGLPGVVSYVT